MMPGYQKLASQGKLRGRVETARERLKGCALCPRACGVDRLAGEKGFCGEGKALVVSSCHPHFGEEAPLVGRHGSGTIFLTGCNLHCVFCQNHEISQLGEGREISGAEMAQMMLYLAKLGCHNINFVTPTHFVPQILESLAIAAAEGLSLSHIICPAGA